MILTGLHEPFMDEGLCKTCKWWEKNNDWEPEEQRRGICLITESNLKITIEKPTRKGLKLLAFLFSITYDMLFWMADKYIHMPLDYGCNQWEKSE